MSTTTEKTVRELALENATATRVFEKLGIDYCCGGNKSLEEACRTANLNIDQVLDSLEMAEQSAHAAQKDRDWQVGPLADLIAHIKNTHHRYTREEVARLSPLFDKVCSVHGNNHPELLQIRGLFQGLSQELTHALDEGRDGPLSVHSKDGRGGNREGTNRAGAVWHGAKPGFDDAARA
jgi:regulator of cell morphogenesis and NO signaling